MATGHGRVVTIALGDLRDLFIAPAVDPFAETELYESGMDHLASVLRPAAPKKLRVVLLLPEERLDGVSLGRAQDAVTRYCRLKVRQLSNELAALFWRGTKALQVGVTFLATCLFLAALIDGSHALAGFPGSFLSEGLTIAGWVSLWGPVEVLLYEWWPVWWERRLYQRLMRMELVLHARSSPAASSSQILDKAQYDGYTVHCAQAIGARTTM